MVGNVWLNRETRELAYNIEDPDYRLLTTGASVDKNTEIDADNHGGLGDGQ
jgi:hypothetical protein